MPKQDRSLYDRSLVSEAATLVHAAFERGPDGPFQFEAATALVHCEATTAAETDWPRIAELYRSLEAHRPTPGVRVNRAFALAKATTALEGLKLLDTAESTIDIPHHPYASMVRAVLLAECGRNVEALDMFEHAAGLARNKYESAEIERRAQALRSLLA